MITYYSVHEVRETEFYLAYICYKVLKLKVLICTYIYIESTKSSRFLEICHDKCTMAKKCFPSPPSPVALPNCVTYIIEL